MAIFESEEGVIAADTDVFTWVKTGTALTNENVACENEFSTKFFDAEPLTMAIATVSGTSLTLFLCHLISNC